MLPSSITRLFFRNMQYGLRGELFKPSENEPASTTSSASEPYPFLSLDENELVKLTSLPDSRMELKSYLENEIA
jgi:hypothetical protein